MRSAVWSIVGGAAFVACTAPAPNAKGADSTAATVASAEASTPVPLSWRFKEPTSWDHRVRMVDDAFEGARLAGQGIHGARRFEYIPIDSSLTPQVLVGFWVYDSTAWAKVVAESGPPQGDEIARSPGVVYIVGLPQSNPFTRGSADFAAFEKRSVTLESVKQRFRVVPLQ